MICISYFSTGNNAQFPDITLRKCTQTDTITECTVLSQQDQSKFYDWIVSFPHGNAGKLNSYKTF